MPTTAPATKPNLRREITLTRVFDAPCALVYSMWTDAKHLANWWGPHTFTNPVCEVDPRPGGKILIHMRAANGDTHPMGGVFHELVPNERIVFTSFVDMPDGKRIVEGHTTVTLEEERGKTRLTLHVTGIGFVDFAERMLAGMEAGWAQSFGKLGVQVACATGRKDADDLAAIDAILGDRTNALFGKVVDLAVKHFADDIVTYSLAPPLAHVGPGKAELQAWFDTWNGPISWTMRDLTVEIGGDIAHARGISHMTGTKTDGAKVDLWLRATVCFGRIGGAWKITHEHTSVPFHMDGSFKAAVDLKPQ
jgi:uncharacterized protein YndB with AHSA1/START domain/ketosteroid isomerase-like protein